MQAALVGYKAQLAKHSKMKLSANSSKSFSTTRSLALQGPTLNIMAHNQISPSTTTYEATENSKTRPNLFLPYLENTNEALSPKPKVNIESDISDTKILQDIEPYACPTEAKKSKGNLPFTRPPQRLTMIDPPQ